MAVTETIEAPAVRLEVEDGVAVIRLDAPGKPVNTISRALMEEMADVIGRLERGEGGVRAAVIVSEKPGIWIAGADIEEFETITTAQEGEALSRAGHALLDRLEGLEIPVVAAIDGAALGGGLEVALACDYRIASDSPKTKLGLPEVQLGILPGAGGTQRLPRLLGIATALDMMLSARMLDGRRAKKVGLVDEVVPATILLRVAKQAAVEIAEGKRHPRAGARTGSPHLVENLPGARTLIFRKARQQVMKKTRGLMPAPLRILEVVEKGIGRPLQEGLSMEAQAFGALAVTPESRSLVHVFFSKTGAENRPPLPAGTRPASVERVSVVGAGFMGAGIAAASVESGYAVRLKDVTPEAVAKGLKTARGILAKRAKRRKRPRREVTQLLDRVAGSAEYAGFGRTDLVVEAVFEDLELKHRVLREIEAVIPEDAVLGSNTSTIPISRLAEACERPERLLGLHFFSPVEKMPLLEIIVTDRTDPQVVATGHAYGKKLGKTPIVVNDAPGFYANRILSPYMAEAALLLEEGASIEAVDRAMVEWGYPVGPITLYDEVGIDVAAKAGTIMTEAFGDRFERSELLERMVGDGRLGRKNGRGFFTYGEDGKKGDPDESVYALIGAPQRKRFDPAQIQERLSLIMVNEALRTLEEGVLRNARDGDVGAVMGIGFPPFRGGPFWYVDEVGAEAVLERLRALEAQHGGRFAPARLLVERAESGERFFETPSDVE